MISKTFGTWTVLELSDSDKPGKRYLCLCSCGNKEVKKAAELKRGRGTSCSSCNPNTRYDSLKEIGKKYGGVFPMMAKREHQKNILPTLATALKKANLLEPAQSVFFTTAKNTDIEKILEREPELLKKTVPFLKKYAKPDIDLISVTNGPGLEPCLWVGVNFAKANQIAFCMIEYLIPRDIR